MLCSSVQALVGTTPTVSLSRLLPGCTVLAKLEAQNPGGSAKDRVALAMLDRAEALGLLKPGGVIIEATSGNTGIGLAWAAACRGYRCIIVLPDSMSTERLQLLNAYGAELVLTPGRLGITGSREKARALAASIPGSYVPDQFSNPANVDIHYRTTGPEIWADTAGRLDIFVAGVGTGGTLTGAGRYLKERDPGIQVVAVEPAGSALLSGGKAGPHGIQGIGPNFIPPLLDRSLLNRVIPVPDAQACAAARLLARKEGILAGISSGAALHAAMTLAAVPENRDKRILALLPDSGERYFSTSLFRAYNSISQ